jgi:hypothetical protein
MRELAQKRLPTPPTCQAPVGKAHEIPVQPFLLVFSFRDIAGLSARKRVQTAVCLSHAILERFGS